MFVGPSPGQVAEATPDFNMELLQVTARRNAVRGLVAHGWVNGEGPVEWLVRTHNVAGTASISNPMPDGTTLLKDQTKSVFVTLRGSNFKDGEASVEVQFLSLDVNDKKPRKFTLNYIDGKLSLIKRK